MKKQSLVFNALLKLKKNVNKGNSEKTIQSIFETPWIKYERLFFYHDLLSVIDKGRKAKKTKRGMLDSEIVLMFEYLEDNSSQKKEAIFDELSKILSRSVGSLKGTYYPLKKFFNKSMFDNVYKEISLLSSKRAITNKKQNRVTKLQFEVSKKVKDIVNEYEGLSDVKKIEKLDDFTGKLKDAVKEIG